MTQEDRGAIVIGGAGGIGSAIVRRLAADGHRVAVVDRDGGGAAQLAAELAGDGHRAAQLDVTDAQQVATVFDALEEHHPSAVLVVASGGPQADLTKRPTIATLDLADWYPTVELNLTGVFLSVRKFAQLRLARPLQDARIIIIGSGSGQVPQEVIDIGYAASKGGLLALSRQAAFDLAPAGITVNVVAPGAVATAAFIANTSEESRAAAVSTVPLRRAATPQEVAAGVAYLASRDASYVTGTTLDINGGIHMH